MTCNRCHGWSKTWTEPDTITQYCPICGANLRNIPPDLRDEEAEESMYRQRKEVRGGKRRYNRNPRRSR